MIELALFSACSIAAMVGALGAALIRNLFHAALLLGVCLAGIAGLYLFLEHSYLACLQVVVYLGGVLVLVLFATLFSADVMGTSQRTPPWLVAVGTGGAALASWVALELAEAVVTHGQNLLETRVGTGHGTDAIGDPNGAIGDLFVGPWLVPFLLAGFLLTVALVAAVATVRRFRRPLEMRGG
jgi:NADH:ubiquinone oxidoreductase subunit 6 (subunit J)